MKNQYAKIDPEAVSGFLGEFRASDFGPVPMMQWVDVSSLVVDYTYQREIGRRGAQNIARIVREFKWLKFAPVVIAAIEGGRFAIVDGQHRTTAAAILGIEQVPCHMIIADRAQQADAFAAINSAVTAMTSMQIHAAKVAAGDPHEIKLKEVCAEAGVAICRYPVPANLMKEGQTLASAALSRMLTKHGQGILGLALRSVTCRGKDSVGMLRAPIISALCEVIELEPVLYMRSEEVIRAMKDFDMQSELSRAAEIGKQRKVSISVALGGLIYGYLTAKLKIG